MTLEKKREITDRIWQHSQAANMGKLVLLALAEYADNDGFCYPSQETIGRMIGLGGKTETIQRNALHHLNPLIKSGELICWKQQGKRGGRGYTNIYLIAIGLTDDQIKERIKRRFGLFDDEVDAALSQDGEVYNRLCTDRRISVEALDPKKGVKIDDKQEEKPPKIDGLNPEKVVKNDPQLPQESEKGVNFGGGTESNKPIESNQQRERVAPALPKEILGQHRELAYKLIAVCGYRHPKFVVNGKLKECADTIYQLVKWDATVDQLDEFPGYWWGDNAPTFKQVVEYWGKFLEWRDKPPKAQRDPPRESRPRESSPPIDENLLEQLRAGKR